MFTSWTVVSCFPSLERNPETACFAFSILADYVGDRKWSMIYLCRS